MTEIEKLWAHGHSDNETQQVNDTLLEQSTFICQLCGHEKSDNAVCESCGEQGDVNA